MFSLVCRRKSDSRGFWTTLAQSKEKNELMELMKKLRRLKTKATGLIFKVAQEKTVEEWSSWLSAD